MQAHTVSFPFANVQVVKRLSNPMILQFVSLFLNLYLFLLIDDSFNMKEKIKTAKTCFDWCFHLLKRWKFNHRILKCTKIYIGNWMGMFALQHALLLAALQSSDRPSLKNLQKQELKKNPFTHKKYLKRNFFYVACQAEYLTAGRGTRVRMKHQIR